VGVLEELIGAALEYVHTDTHPSIRFGTSPSTLGDIDDPVQRLYVNSGVADAEWFTGIRRHLLTEAAGFCGLVQLKWLVEHGLEALPGEARPLFTMELA
jgi:hypothetical protein